VSLRQQGLGLIAKTGKLRREGMILIKKLKARSGPCPQRLVPGKGEEKGGVVAW